jgi:hypothetical protein
MIGRCKNCIYYDKESLECHKKAPVAKYNEDTKEWIGQFPKLFDNNWCGEFCRKYSSLDENNH